jgi:hypothetical protein
MTKAAKKKTATQKKDVEALLKQLADSAPIGKDGTPKAVIKPFTKDITQYLSARETKVPEVVEVTIQELFNIAPVAIQRDVHLRKAKNRKYLSDNINYCVETGRMFSPVRYTDGSLELADGNTRVANYYDELVRCVETGEPPRFEIPATVTLVIHDQDSKEDAHMLYLSYDNAAASEKTIERMSGVKDVLGVKFKKPYLDKVNYKQGLKVVSGKIPGITIEKIPNEEYGLLKEFLPELEYLDKYSNFDSKPVGGDDIAIIAGLLRKFRHSPSMKRQIITLANKVFSPKGEGVIVLPNGGRNAVSYLRDEYYNSKPQRRFPHRSSKRSQLLGFWVHYLEESENDKILTSATKKSDDTLQGIGNAFLKS